MPFYLRVKDRADLKICGTNFSYPMILSRKSIILSVLRYMRVIPGVFGAFWGDFWPFSPSLSEKWSFLRKTKKSIFSIFFFRSGLNGLAWASLQYFWLFGPSMTSSFWSAVYFIARSRIFERCQSNCHGVSENGIFGQNPQKRPSDLKAFFGIFAHLLTVVF